MSVMSMFRIIPPLRARWPGRFDHFSEELFHWSRAVVETRVFCLGNIEPLPDAPADSPLASPQTDSYMLLPVADLLNHSPEKGCLMPQSQSAPLVAYDASRKAVVMRASQDFEAGEPLTFCYSPHSNQELLLIYGFALLRNPYNWVQVQGVHIPSDHKARRQNLTALTSAVAKCTLPLESQCCTRAAAEVSKTWTSLQAALEKDSVDPVIAETVETYRKARVDILDNYLAELRDCRI